MGKIVVKAFVPGEGVEYVEIDGKTPNGKRQICLTDNKRDALNCRTYYYAQNIIDYLRSVDCGWSLEIEEIEDDYTDSGYYDYF